MKIITSPISESEFEVSRYVEEVKIKSNKIIDYILLVYFLIGMLLATVYDTWNVAFGISIPLLSAYYISKLLLPKSNLYQYVLSAVLGLFMAQFIYQMHGMFEMHFFAFIGSAILIIYNNWKLQIPMALVVILHHGFFGYLQYKGMNEIYFTQLDYMDIQTFTIHSILAIVIFFLCGFWSYNNRKFGEKFIKQTFELGKLQKTEKQNEIIRKTNLELDKFVYSVSHDLRAPLLSMQGLIDITEMFTEEDITKKHMEMLRESAQKLDTFITDIHNYSRNARLELKLEIIDFEEILNGLNQQLAYMNGTRLVNMIIDVKGESDFVSDKYRIQMILNNLISNAIRYQNIENKNPYVKVTVRTSEKLVSITVEDNGIGIDEENQNKVFNMFYRVSDQSKGSGLGLYIVKETVDVLKGEISINSKIGIGTTFQLIIPNNIKNT